MAMRCRSKSPTMVPVSRRSDRDHVFEPFFTTRLESGGSGLGLSVAEGVVTDRGGAIEFESQPEKGTRVTVRLPLEISDS